MDRPQTVPLFLKTAALLLLPVLFLSLGTVLVLIEREKDTLIEASFQHLQGLTTLMADHSRMPLLENDALTLSSLTRSMSSMDAVAQVSITDSKGQVLAHSGGPRSKTSPGLEPVTRRLTSAHELAAALASSPGRAVLTRPVTFQDRVLGEVHLEPSMQKLDHSIAAIPRAVLKKLSPLFAASLILVALIAFMLSRTWKLSLERLTKAISQCMAGGLKPDIQPIRPREMQSVLDIVHEMSEQCRFELTRMKGLDIAPKNTLFSPVNPGLDQWPLQISRTQVSVLFAGIKGFRKYAQERKPLELLQDLNEFFELAKRSITFRGGSIDKFIGDALIAVFTPSPEKGEHTRNAVDSAIDLQNVLARTSQGGNQLLTQVGIGISSGVVLSGLFGEGEHKTHTFIGESFKAAYSLNIMAGPGEILISRDVYQLVENHVAVEPVPPLEMTRTTASWENFRLIHPEP